MGVTITKFSFDVMGSTLSETSDKLDSLVLDLTSDEKGEPWVVIEDSFSEKTISLDALLSGNPDASFYHGTRTVVFTGPNTTIGGETVFHDGFRPQGDTA
jgi:hypothetical protein